MRLKDWTERPGEENTAQAIAMLADVERLCPQLVKAPPGGLLQPVDLDSAMNALRHE